MLQGVDEKDARMAAPMRVNYAAKRALSQVSAYAKQAARWAESVVGIGLHSIAGCHRSRYGRVRGSRFLRASRMVEHSDTRRVVADRLMGIAALNPSW